MKKFKIPPCQNHSLSPISRALARSFFLSGEKRPFHLSKRISSFIYRGEMHFDSQKMGKLQTRFVGKLASTSITQISPVRNLNWLRLPCRKREMGSCTTTKKKV